jgi:hypothetical protein
MFILIFVNYYSDYIYTIVDFLALKRSLSLLIIYFGEHKFSFINMNLNINYCNEIIYIVIYLNI